MAKTAKELIVDIQKLFKDDDWRDVFERIHNWGYNTDFTYNDITNPKDTSVEEYLEAFIKDMTEE